MGHGINLGFVIGKPRLEIPFLLFCQQGVPRKVIASLGLSFLTGGASLGVN